MRLENLKSEKVLVDFLSKKCSKIYSYEFASMNYSKINHYLKSIHYSKSNIILMFNYLLDNNIDKLESGLILSCIINNSLESCFEFEKNDFKYLGYCLNNKKIKLEKNNGPFFAYLAKNSEIFIKNNDCSDVALDGTNLVVDIRENSHNIGFKAKNSVFFISKYTENYFNINNTNEIYYLLPKKAHTKSNAFELKEIAKDNIYTIYYSNNKLIIYDKYSDNFEINSKKGKEIIEKSIDYKKIITEHPEIKGIDLNINENEKLLL
ncbi:MAG: hypothetical protein PHN56_01015 [Candidatus Nanoarchaeia archaeon]|nr:hypothetical protein [Candidatus Nanoarchaeia archaeon]